LLISCFIFAEGYISDRRKEGMQFSRIVASVRRIRPEKRFWEEMLCFDLP